MRTAITLAALLLTLPAAAQNNSNNNIGGWHVQTGPNGQNSPRAAALSAASAATGASTSSAGGGSASVSTGSDRVIVAPALPGMASGPCTGAGGGISIGVIGFAGGAGYTSTDRGCDARETARVAFAIGMTAEAKAIMRREVERVLGAAAAPDPAAVTPPPVAAPPSPRPAWCDTASGPERRRVGYIRECAQ